MRQSVLSPTVSLSPFSTAQACFKFFAPFGFVTKNPTPPGGIFEEFFSNLIPSLFIYFCLFMYLFVCLF